MSTSVLENSLPLTFDVTALKMTDEAFYEFCQRNQEYQFEMNAGGELIVIPPTFLESSRKNNEINFQLISWSKKDKTGVVFESDGMFTLPNGAKRAPDAFWITKDRYYALPEKEREERFARIVPDFVIELRSKSDDLQKLQNKMSEYIENGVRLGGLIDPYQKRVYVYRASGEIEILENPVKVSGGNVLQGFELDLTEIW
jgi:Uma2 family endonuclease